MTDINTILALPLKITYLSVDKQGLQLSCESEPLGWMWNRYVYSFEIRDAETFDLNLNSQQLTGKFLLDSKVKVKIFEEHSSILYSDTPAGCVAIFYDGEIALKGTQKYHQFNII